MDDLWEWLGNALAFILYIMAVCFCIGVFLMILGGSLFVGGFGGFFTGIFNGFKSYFSALAENLKMRS